MKPYLVLQKPYSANSEHNCLLVYKPDVSDKDYVKIDVKTPYKITMNKQNYGVWYNTNKEYLLCILTYIYDRLKLIKNLSFSIGPNTDRDIAQYLYNHSSNALKTYHKVLR